MERLRVIVAGLAGASPVGGMAWHYLQYVLGLHRLGHDVYYHEDTWSWPYDPVANAFTSKGTYSARFLASFMDRYAPELADRWHYLHLHTESHGMSGSRFAEVARTTDVFLNVSGACFLPEQLPADCIKIFLDTDPGYNQVVLTERFEWAENVDRWTQSVHEHDLHFTFAENMHGDDCLVPDAGLKWRTTRMPIVLSLWEDLRRRPPAQRDPWTTIMTWNAFPGRLVHDGVEYGSKGMEFERILELPDYVKVPLKVAVGGREAPLDRLEATGWRVVSGPQSTLSPEQYQDFIAGSRGEISTAKNVYVGMRTGWFSERTACYLAGGRPAVVQDTGFSGYLPTGEGLLAFDDLQGAAEAIGFVEEAHERHARAARELAAEFFDAKEVLTDLLEAARC